MACSVVVAVPVVQGVASALPHHAVELVWIDEAVAIAVGLFNHLLQLFVCKALPQLLSYALQVPERDLSGLVLVEKRKDLVDLGPRVLVRHPPPHHVAEVVEVDGLTGVLADVCQHAPHVLLLDLEAQGPERSLQLSGVDGARVLCVEEVEGLPKLLHLLLIQALPLALRLATATGGSCTAGARQHSAEAPGAAADPPAAEGSGAAESARVPKGALGC
mmetsp:Transcript_10041/g.30000  ORF Transcript_10041/g.30000 Transcript_10041/m.30000 type:complete len:218 (+) Transcript_10041:203-856(+)